MGNCTTKLPTDNSYTNPLSHTPLIGPTPTITPPTTDTNPDASTTDLTNRIISTSNRDKKDSIVVLLTESKRRLLIYGYARYICGVFVPGDILETITLSFIDDAFIFRIKSDELYKFRHETDSVVSVTSSIFIYRNIHFQLQITKILKEHNDHGFQLSARLLSKNVIITTTIALQCIETNCGYHNFVENFFESGWPSSTLKISDINDDITELNFICKFDILRIQPIILKNNITHSTETNNIKSFYKSINMNQKVDFQWKLDSKISPSYRTDNDDSSLILFYESPQFENDSFVIHFIQSNVMERDGFAVMLELFSYPFGVTKVTLKWIVIVNYDGKIIKKSSTDDFALNDSCHSKAFSKSDFHFIGETHIFSLSLLTINVNIEVLEIYNEYNERIKWENKYNCRHWPNYGIKNTKYKQMDEKDEKENNNNNEIEINNLKNQIKQMDEKLNQLLIIQNDSNSICIVEQEEEEENINIINDINDINMEIDLN
eukprot:224519_1